MVLKDFEPETIQEHIGLWAISHPSYIRGQVNADVINEALSRQSFLCIYYIAGIEGNLLILQANKIIEKAKPSSLALIETPSCFWGDTILIRRISGKLESAIIKRIIWHSKRGNHYYDVEVAGKMISRWVFEEDVLMKL